MSSQEIITLREEVMASDRASIRKMLELSNCFHNYEVDIAIELIDERLTKGESSGYNFLIANSENIINGYSCYGPIPCTQSSFDLYWIAVDQHFRGKGLGTHLMAETEKRIRLLGGTRVYIETSSRKDYNAAQSLYQKCGYKQEARFSDFYAPKDDKIVFVKDL